MNEFRGIRVGNDYRIDALPKPVVGAEKEPITTQALAMAPEGRSLLRGLVRT